MAFVDKYGVKFSDDKTKLVSFPKTFRGSYTIPNGIRCIGEDSFLDCDRLTSITIPNSVVSIEANAFCGCTNLISVDIPNTVTSIGFGAFYDTGIYNDDSNWENYVLYISNCLIDINPPFSFILKTYTIKNSTRLIANSALSRCRFLTSINIPDSLLYIGKWVFDSQKLMSITVSSNNPNYTSENGVLFDKNKKTLIKCPAGKQDEYVIPEQVTNIGDGAFANCSKITSVYIPQGVRSIGCAAFAECYWLKSIYIPHTITNIGDGAFDNCISLRTINIPYGVTDIQDRTFSGCTNLTDISIPTSITSIGFGAFSKCKSLNNITIPSSVKHIGQAAFSETGYFLNESNWENGVLYINNCLVSSKAFSLASTLVIKDGTRLIADSVFWQRKSLISIKIPDSVTSIGNNAFLKCSELSSISIPNGVAYIGYQAFSNCYKLTTIVIPHSVRKIGSGAFAHCNALTDLTIINGVVSIGDNAFKGCSSLTSLLLPSSVSSIGVNAFGDCSSLSLIKVDINNPNYCSVDDVLFDIDKTTLIKCSIGKSGSYVIPTSVKCIQQSAFSNCKELSCISIPESVNSIGEYAFFNCKSLSSISLHDKITDFGSSIFLSCDSLKKIFISKGKIEEYCELGLEYYRSLISERYNTETDAQLYNEQMAAFMNEIQQSQTMKITDSNSDRRYLFFDTECNGLPPNYLASIYNTSNWPRLIQIAWLLTDELGNVIKQQNYIIYPQGFIIDNKIAELTGISTDRAKTEGVKLEDALSEFIEDLTTAEKVIGHNVDFDCNVVGCELYRTEGAYNELMSRQRICTMQATTNYCAIPNKTSSGGYKWPKLEELYRKLFGRIFDNAHDALSDVTATKECYFELKNRGII